MKAFGCKKRILVENGAIQINPSHPLVSKRAAVKPIVAPLGNVTLSSPSRYLMPGMAAV